MIKIAESRNTSALNVQYTATWQWLGEISPAIESYRAIIVFSTPYTPSTPITPCLSLFHALSSLEKENNIAYHPLTIEADGKIA